MQYLVGLIDKARQRGSCLLYTELRALVWEVRAHLATSDDAEMLVVMLKGLVPQHIKAQFCNRMTMLRRPPIRNNFLWYLLNELNEEIKAQETDPRRMASTQENDKELAKDKSPKVLGKLYPLRRAPSLEMSEEETSESPSEQGEVLVGTGKKEWPLCGCCGEGKHGLHNCCKFFLVLTLREKVSYAKQQKLCHKCLRDDHAITKLPLPDWSGLSLLFKPQTSLPPLSRGSRWGRDTGWPNRRGQGRERTPGHGLREPGRDHYKKGH